MFHKIDHKKIALAIAMILVPFFTTEIVLRIYFALHVGPDVLLYGTPYSRHQQTYDPKGAWDRKQKTMHTVDFHENIVANYWKYYPHQTRIDFDENDEPFSVTINAQGFRGKEIEKEKKPGVIRIVTLGSSSTFGFRDRDHETYPYYMEQILNEMVAKRSCTSGKAFEVINLGMPHLFAENIYSLFMNEALPLQPDIVTFYEGVNDAAKTPEEEPSTLGKTKQAIRALPLIKVYRELRYRSITFAFLASIISKEITEFAERDLKTHIQGRSEECLRYVSSINEECKKRKLLFVVATQQAQSLTIDRPKMKGLTYEREVELIREKLAKTGKLTREQMWFLTHDHIMGGLRRWVAENHVVLVDAIKAMDQDRDSLLSWVHLNARGNRIVATEFAERIYGLTCSQELTSVFLSRILRCSIV